MFIWRGFGILVPVIYIGVSIAVQQGLNQWAGVDISATETWPQAIAAFISGTIIWFFGLYVNSKTQEVIDKKTGKEFVLRPDNSVFFIPMQYWGLIIVIIGIIFLFIDPTQL